MGDPILPGETSSLSEGKLALLPSKKQIVIRPHLSRPGGRRRGQNPNPTRHPYIGRFHL